MALPAGLAVAWFAIACCACCLSWTPPVRRRLGAGHRALMLAALAAVAVRIVPALSPLPPDAIVRYDLESYRAVADAVLSGRDVYDMPGRYPYLPLHMYVFAGAAWLAGHTGLPLGLLVKLPAIAADAALVILVGRTATALGRRDGGALAMVYAFNPVTLLVTSYHGQFDAIPTALALWAWYLVAFHRSARATALSALLFGLAVADKTWPLLLAPVLLWRVPRQGREVDRAIAAHLTYLAVAALPVLGVLLLYERLVLDGAYHALRVVTGYQGLVGTWGYSNLLTRAAPPDLQADAVYRAGHLGPWVLGAALLSAYVVSTRFRRDQERLAFVLVVTYAAAAGWGVHWLAWMAPIAVMAARRWSAAFLAGAGAYTAATFLGFGGVLYGLVSLTGSLEPLTWAATVNLVCWSVFAAVAIAVAAWTLMVRPVGVAANRTLARRRTRRARVMVPPAELPASQTGAALPGAVVVQRS
jgi:hypothetical protein